MKKLGVTTGKSGKKYYTMLCYVDVFDNMPDSVFRDTVNSMLDCGKLTPMQADYLLQEENKP